MQNDMRIRRYSNVKARKIDWLWYPYIAFGKITLLQGDPGDGKSTFALQLTALLTTGKKLPDGTRGREPINVIYQCKEDDPADTIKPRLLQAGANCDRVLFLGNGEDLTLDDERLEKSILDSKARLIIFDPIQSFLSEDADMVNAVKMRSIMAQLAKIAQKTNCAILLIGHMNKASGGKELYRLLGSIDLAASARSVLMISRDEDDPDVRYMKQIKNNLGYQGLTITFKFDRHGFHWGEVIVPDKELIEIGKQAAPLDRAKEAIIALLQNGDCKATEVSEHLELLDISTRTSNRAKKELKIRTYKSGNAWYWHLPNDTDDDDNSHKEE